MMVADCVDTRGITPLSEMHAYYDIPYAQQCQTDKLQIHPHDPNIRKIIRVAMDTEISNFKIIPTPAGKNLIIYAIRRITAAFQGNDQFGTQHVIQTAIPYCLYIVLGECHRPVQNVRIFIEDIYAAETDPRSIAVSSLLLAVPVFEGLDARQKKHGPSVANDHDIRCDIQLKCSSDGGKVGPPSTV